MTTLEWPSYRLFPYERQLALREVRALEPGFSAAESDSGVSVASYVTDAALNRMTYFSRALDGDSIRIPQQAVVEEASRSVARRRQLRQSTRFLVHNLHEYKGKFNPQMARSLVNIFGTDASLIIDPYSGSGTTLVEAMRLGKSAFGLDLNPIAAWLTDVKVRALTDPSPELLADEFRRLARRALVAAEDETHPSEASLLGLWGEPSVEYLRSWIPPTVLGAMCRVLTLAAEQGGLAGELLRMAVSSEVRNSSWQLPEDLRVRRRPEGWVPPMYRAVLETAVQRMLISLDELACSARVAPDVGVSAVHGDARDLHHAINGADGESRAIVTSPPYATALPYIDTDRLSLVALGLIQPAEIRVLERQLTGSREWTIKDSHDWNDKLESNGYGLPDAIVRLCTEIRLRNVRDGGGFRRAAVPALLYRYFANMSDAFESWSRVLRPGEHAVLVVGSNRTGERSDPIEIDTPRLTAACASQHGFELSELLPFEVWARYGIHAKNGVPGESAVVLRRTA